MVLEAVSSLPARRAVCLERWNPPPAFFFFFNWPRLPGLALLSLPG